MSSIILGIYIYLQAPREIGHWYLAAAAEHWTESEYARDLGDSSRAAEKKELAFANLEEGLKRGVDDPGWIFERAKWRLTTGKYQEALADCNLVMERLGEGSTLLLLRIEIYQQLGRHADAVKDGERLTALSKTSGNPPRGDALNTLAYIQAVGKIDLPRALDQASAAVSDASATLEQIEAEERREAEMSMLEKLLHAATKEQREELKLEAKLSLAMRLDTRGFVHYQMGHFEEALKDLQPAADGCKNLFADSQLVLKRKRLPDGRQADILAARGKKAAAVVFYHRALAHEKLGHASAAETDRRRVRELIGRDGDESLF